MAEKDLGEIIKSALDRHPHLDILSRREEPSLPEAECSWGIGSSDKELCFQQATVWIGAAGYCDAHAETVLKALG